MSIIEPPNSEWEYPHLSPNPDKLEALLQSAITARTKYGLGAKINPLSLQATDSNWPREVDCSGFFRWILFHALGQPANFTIPDGSQNQLEWAQNEGFKNSTWQDALNDDGYVRAGFLKVGDFGESIGHVWLVVCGKTLESYGGHGPGSRALVDTPILHTSHYVVIAKNGVTS